MKKFITGPGPDYKIVNLDNVTNIAFEETDKSYKIIFNMNYGVSLKHKTDKIIPDYVYFKYEKHQEQEKDQVLQELDKLINEKMWIAPVIDNEVTRIANPRYISFIATDEYKNRIILNLSTSISFHSDNKRKTSDFMYLDFTNKEEYKNNLEYIKDQLNQLSL